MGLPSRQRVTFLFVILWLAGCTTATVEPVATSGHLPALVQPSPTMPLATAPSQPSPMPQPLPTATVQLPTIQPEPTQAQPAEETAPAPQVIRFSVVPTPAHGSTSAIPFFWSGRRWVSGSNSARLSVPG